MSENKTFNKGDIVKSNINNFFKYEVLEVYPKKLKVRCTEKGYTDTEYTCDKSIFFKTG